MNSARPLRGRSAFLFALAAGALGFGLNRLGLPVFGGTEILFGGAATLLAVYSLGPWWGLLATLIAFGETWATWGHPWGLLVFSLEAVVIGQLQSRREIHPLKSAVFYWLLVGVPLSALGILGHTRVPFPSNWAIVIKYPINSLLMAMVALPVYYARPWRQFLGLPLDRDAREPLRRILFLRVGLIMALSIATFGLYAGGAFDRTLRTAASEELVTDGGEMAIEVDDLLDRNLRAITQLAETLATTPNLDVSVTLERLQRLHPGFLTLLAADADGTIVAACPPRDRSGNSLVRSGMSIADRPYFVTPRATGQPFVSDIFQGRGFGRDLIVAMSAPVIDGSGRFRGLVEGSLKLGALTDALARAGQLHDRTVVIVDRTGRVVAARGQTHAQALRLFAGDPLHLAARDQETDAFLYDNTDTEQAERFIGTRHTLPRFGWQIYLAEPIWRTQRTIAGFYLATAFGAAGAIGLALLLARGTATEITLPLNQLVGATRRLAAGEGEQEPVPLLHAARELTDIGREVQAATTTLSRANRQLASAVAERDRTHEQLRQVLVHLEDKVRDRTRELEEARRTAESASEAKSEFLASMSHELRTPLNVVVGMSELIGDQSLGPLNERQVEGLQNINESGRHLLELINDILDLSKIEAGMLELHREPMVVASLCQTSVRFVAEAARRKNISLETNLRHRSEVVVADERRLKQVLVNLLANAVKFTPAGGRVGLDVQEGDDDATLRFEVWDTGIGIAREDFERIFQPFEQIDSSLSRQYAGTGLGLALVRRMTELHGGTIALDSETGRGSRFAIAIPRVLPDAAVPDAESVSPHATTSSAPQSGRLRVLIAEDNEANHQVYAAFFASRGCELMEARDGAAAVECALEWRPDLILMDVQMPVMDGIEATRRLRQDARTQDIPIIAITALAMPEDRLRCVRAGANAYLSKPINLRELSRLVARFCTPSPATSAAP